MTPARANTNAPKGSPHGAPGGRGSSSLYRVLHVINAPDEEDDGSVDPRPGRPPCVNKRPNHGQGKARPRAPPQGQLGVAGPELPERQVAPSEKDEYQRGEQR